MPPLFDIMEAYFFSFLIALIRITSFFYTAPVFGGTTVPPQAKIGIAAIMSAIVISIKGPLPFPHPLTFMDAFLLVISEVAFGITLGYAASLVFAGVQLAGVLIGYQMGFAVANVLDPVSNEQVSIIGQFLFLFSLLYFLTMDGHYILIKGMVDSFAVASPGSFAASEGALAQLLIIFARMFWLGLKIATPVIGVVFLVDVALGIVAKTVPQMNVFIIGLPLKTLLGVLVLTLAFPFLAAVMRIDFDWMAESIYTLMHAIAS